MIRPGALFYRLRRDAARGLRATWADYRIAPRIWHWRHAQASLPLENVPVHVLCGREHLTLCAWMLASWSHHTRRHWPIVVHDDGTLPAGAEEFLRALGLSVSVIPRATADARMATLLADLPRCAGYRARHPLALKIFDAPRAAGGRFILLDTDVLFFAPPVEMLAWVDRPRDDSCWFNADCAEASNVSPADASAQLGVTLRPRVNSGICLLASAAVDLAFCERILRDTTALAGHIWRVEQTLFALNASRHPGGGGLLPSAYEVSLGATAAPGCIARHYVGAVRDRFYAEGMWRARRVLLPHG